MTKYLLFALAAYLLYSYYRQHAAPAAALAGPTQPMMLAPQPFVSSSGRYTLPNGQVSAFTGATSTQYGIAVPGTGLVNFDPGYTGAV